MTQDALALLRSVCESPQSDVPRMQYAEWLEEDAPLPPEDETKRVAGVQYRDVERAEFVRAQCELARVNMIVWQEAKWSSDMCWGCWIKAGGKEYQHLKEVKKFGCKCSGRVTELRRRERELLDANETDWIPECLNEMVGIAIADRAMGDPTELPWKWSRGFIASVRLSWQDFCRVQERLIWVKGGTVQCPGIAGGGPPHPPSCPHCGPGDGRFGTGRVKRPFLASMQPVSTVALTDWPCHAGEIAAHTERFYATIGDSHAEFVRHRCQTCDGTVSVRLGGVPLPYIGRVEKVCDSCRGQPLNSWSCETWPQIDFVMPVPTMGVDMAVPGSDRTAIRAINMVDLMLQFIPPRGIFHGPV